MSGEVSLAASVVRAIGISAGVPRFRLDAKKTEIRGDGKQVAIFDHTQKTALLASDMRALMDSGNEELLALICGFFFDGGENSIMAEAQHSKKLKLLGQANIAKQPCYELSFEISDPEEQESMTIRLWISSKDFLPRQIEAPEGKITLSEMRRNPKLEPDAFSTRAPKGYTQKKIEKPAALKIGSVAPDWTLKSPGGKPVTLSKLKGKVVLVTFWASW